MTALAIALVLVLAVVAPALAYDPQETFKKGVWVASLEGGYGEQTNLEDHRVFTGLTFYNYGLRLSRLPFDPVLPGPLWGSLEVGLEGFFQQYVEPHRAYSAGLGLMLRYHFLSLGRLVPYLELFGSVVTNELRTREIDSDVGFLVFGGPGVSYFVMDRLALYGGYRFQHVSNANSSPANRGFESHSGVIGVSVYFP